MVRSSTRQLAVPFAVGGTAVGWFTAGYLAHPLIGIAYDGKQPFAATAGACLGAGLGWALTRVLRRYDAEEIPVRVQATLASAALVAFAFAGALVGALTASSLDRVPFGIGTGALCGLCAGTAVTPFGVLVVRAARRAARARMGSLVAASDARAVWCALASAVALLSLTAAIDWPAASATDVAPPRFAMTILIAVTAGLFGILCADAWGLARVTAVALTAGSMEERAHSDAADAIPNAPRVDLGLGSQVRAGLSRRARYHEGERVVALLLGSPEAARRALRVAVVRDIGACVLAAAIVVMHVVAMGAWAEQTYLKRRCDAGVATACPPVVDPIATIASLSPPIVPRSPPPTRFTPKGTEPGCYILYHFNGGHRETRTNSLELRECIKDVARDISVQCTANPAPPGSAMASGHFNLIVKDQQTVTQVFATSCERRSSGKELCYQSPCDPAMGPSCEACPPGKIRNDQCECVYQRGEHECTVRFLFEGGEWDLYSESDTLAGCQTDGEQEFRRRCTGDAERSTRFGRVSVGVWREGFYKTETATATCADLLAGKGFCQGPDCPLPCPKDECMHDGKCVVPGGPTGSRNNGIAGLCGHGGLCRVCK